MSRLLALATSLRATAVLLVLLGALLLLNVLLPQAAVDAAAYARALQRGAAARFFLETLELGHVATSPAFVAVLGAFLVNLVAVLVDRTAATVRRVRLAPPTAARLEAMLAAPGQPAPIEAALDAPAASEVLRELGYRTAPVGAAAVWGVKHRLAPLGFLLFHASFLLILAAGLQLYLTRDVVKLVATEGVETDSRAGVVARRAPLGAAAPLRIAVERVDVALSAGQPTALAATLAIDGGEPRTARVNAPVEHGPASVLVENAGIAPVLWLVDAGGFTVDRVLVPLVGMGRLPVRVPMASGALEVVVEPIRVGAGFPERAALGAVPIELRVVGRAGETVFDGVLRPGEGASFGDRTLRVPEVRYWVALRLVEERGGALLVVGFLGVIVGLLWRMLFFRRELAIALDAGATRIAGRAELFPAQFRGEVALARELLVARARSTVQPGNVS